MSSRLIRSHELAEACQPWLAPEVASPDHPGGHDTVDSAATRQQAWREGFEDGRRAGLEAAQGEVAARSQALETALDALARPFEGLEHRFHEEIVELVRAVARQLVRREMRLDPSHVAGVVREALAALPMSATDITVRVHPQDAAVLEECLAPAQGPRAWRIESDPLMERGSCLVTTTSSQVDGRLETRLARTIATLFDDPRNEGATDAGTTPDADAGQ
ncbi:MAG: FliH/SctL family protein [Gammaproteobacteria bacterium]